GHVVVKCAGSGREGGCMRCVHGAWLPDEPGAFVQSGAFFLWVETDGPAKTRDQSHPRQLGGEGLAEFLSGPLGLAAPARAALAREAREIAFLLPSAGGVPLPSYELLPYVETEVPAGIELAWWRVCCLPAPSVIRTLNDLHFLALQAEGDFQLGADLLFWHHFTQLLKEIINRDRFIPALRLQHTEGRARKGRKPPEGTDQLYYGWEWVSDLYADAVPRFAAAMPVACRAAARQPGPPALFAPEPLLRHFA